MTPTPHPADALPLPEPFMAMCRDTVPHIYDAWANQLRAARREGYELAMSKTTALVDALNGLLYSLPDVLPQGAHERFRRTGKWAAGNSYSLRGHTGKIEYRADDMEVVYSAIDEAAQALVKPIHDPAVTTPREVLVGESPVDRIAAPAQEQPKQLGTYVSVNSGALQMVRNALKRDAEEGKQSRREMLEELDKVTYPIEQRQAGAPAQEHPHDTEDGSRRWVLVQSLKASKGWATEFAEAFIDEFLSTEAQQQAGVA